MSYTYGHEAAKKKNDTNTYRNLVRKGINAKKAKFKMVSACLRN